MQLQSRKKIKVTVISIIFAIAEAVYLLGTDHMRVPQIFSEVETWLCGFHILKLIHETYFRQITRIIFDL